MYHDIMASFADSATPGQTVLNSFILSISERAKRPTGTMYIKYHPILQLCDVLGNKDFPLQLAAACKSANIEQDSPLVLHIEASLGPGRGSNRILLVS